MPEEVTPLVTEYTLSPDVLSRLFGGNFAGPMTLREAMALRGMGQDQANAPMGGFGNQFFPSRTGGGGFLQQVGSILGSQPNNLNQALEGAALRDYHEARRISDEQFTRNQEAIEALGTGTEELESGARERATESRDFLRDKIEGSREKNEQSIEGVLQKSEEATALAEKEMANFQDKLDKMLRRTEADQARTRRAYESDVAASIQNQRRAADIAFQRTLSDLEASGRGQSSTEFQQAKQAYGEQLGLVASRAFQEYNRTKLDMNLTHDAQMAQMVATTAGLGLQGTTQMQGVRQAEVATASNMAGLMASMNQTADQQLGQVEAMYLQAEQLADSLKMQGLTTVAELTMRNVPTFVPLAGVISQIMALRFAMQGQGGWGSIQAGESGGFGTFGGLSNAGGTQGEGEYMDEIQGMQSGTLRAVHDWYRRQRR